MKVLVVVRCKRERVAIGENTTQHGVDGNVDRDLIADVVQSRNWESIDGEIPPTSVTVFGAGRLNDGPNSPPEIVTSLPSSV